ncbi:MAG: Fic family protein [Granulosicoccus sp.]
MSSESTANTPRAATNFSRTLPRLPVASRIETISALKSCLPARAALAAFSQALKQSALRPIATDSYALLDSVGAIQLQGLPVDLLSALQDNRLGSQPELQRHLDARNKVQSRLSSEPVGSSMALQLASDLEGKPVSVRRGDGQRLESEPTNRAYSQLPLPQGAEKLQALLEDWQSFVQHSSADLDPLLMTAAAHGQWIALRPFTHANISLCQLLTSLLLTEEGLQPVPVLPLALYFSRHAEKYWQNLHNAVVMGDHGSWIQFFMTAVEEASVDAIDQLAQWQNSSLELGAAMNSCLPKAPSAALIETCSRPSFGLADLAQTGLARRQTASAWMQKLVDIGVIEELRIGKEKRYINRQVVSLLLS